MMIDFDRFKQINDGHGHDMGDLVLRQAAIILRREARAEDVICRMGGEEFLVISPDTPLAAAMHLAERLRSAVASTRFATGMVSCAATISAGVAQREPGMTRVDELIKAADNALYGAKGAGRNRVVAGQTELLPKAATGSAGVMA
jgi:diguanylate cyclase (GGDEF)-like protein